MVVSTADSGAGSLRAALAAASPGETISIPTPGDYLATSAELAVTKDVTIEGSGPAVRIVADGNNRVFNVTAASVTLSDLTVTGGGLAGSTAAGGGIANGTGTLVLDRVTVKGNSVTNTTGGIPRGGGVFNAAGTLQIVDSTISGNSAAIGSGGGGLPEGGGVANAGTAVSIVRSTISGNTASIAGPGGAPEGGGIQSTNGTLTISDSAVTDNTGSGGAVSLGGGIAAFFTTTTLTNTTVSGNAASEPGASASQGGGILQFQGSLSLVNSTISGNTSSGAVTGEGGGVDAEETTATATNSTIAGNVASGAAALGGDVLSAREATVNLQNTIVAGGTALTGANCAAEPKSVIHSLGHNLESRNECGLTAGNDIVNADPLLAPLAGNGGPTQTMALAPGSRAIDAAAGAACPATDQRGVLRSAGAGCDIGAFELATPTATSGQASAVGLSSATLGGVASNPDLAGATAVFQYGTTTAYGLVLPTQAIGPTTASAAISATVGGLTPATVYHFRLVVQNGVSTSFGADHTFTTAALPVPLVQPPVAPVLSGLAVKPGNVLPQRGRGASTARARGAKISYSDTSRATTTLTVARISTGFRVGKRCQRKRPSHPGGKLRRCTLAVVVGSFTHADVRGLNSFGFTGRVNSKPLRAGSYRLQARARNSTGQTSRIVATTFRVIS
ncbi:MAG TPA: choice-of-anchor Q domain-containing protein [Solirubrobacteraceae bacterium]|nr:choice-of-anchor Q domain-containing protein [Solirubrobacteraceae bacterium]